MIKQLSKPCWIYVCDKCGKELEGGEGFVVHYLTEKDALLNIDEYEDFWEGKKQVLCEDCINKLKGGVQ